MCTDNSRGSSSAPSVNHDAQCNGESYITRDPSDRNPRFHSLTDFAKENRATRVIQKILIANNGMAAVKCMSSLRKWAYAKCGDADALSFVCMATPEDVHGNAEYIKIANKTVMVPGGSNQNNYANVELILQTALANEVDAVWAGWGHASENPQLPDVLSKHNIAFLGPPHYAMWALGDKVASTILAQSADVPTLPWSGSNIRLPISPCPSDLPTDCRSVSNGQINRQTVSVSSAHSQEAVSLHTSMPAHLCLDRSPQSLMTVVPEDVYHRACVTDVASCQACADEIGYPVMIKAAEGGGGKGIRKALNPNDIVHYFPQVQTEVPGSAIFVMKCAEKSRHLEIQLLGDEYGEAISLFGRDCSIQRRHQKIIEEAPVIIAPKHTIEAMERAAVRLAKLVGYVNAGTVEYLYNPDSDQFYFLELNPRLQVEHPCTEVIAEVNLPACQLQIAMGIPLHRIKDVRELYRMPPSPTDDSVVSFEKLEPMRRVPSHHVIAARITSEDPDEGFKPRPGDVQELNFKSSQSVWGYFSVGSAGGIHEFADSQFGHCFSSSETREQARENLVLALKELSIRGDFRTTVEYLIRIMESEDFINNQVNTSWLDERIAEKDQVEKPDLLLGVVCTALHIADRALRQLTRNYELHLERGQCLPANTLTNRVDVTLVSGCVKFVVKVFRTGPSNFHIVCNDSLLCVEVHRMSSDGLLVCHELASYMTYCHEDANVYRTVINNRTMAFTKETDPSVLRSHSTGKLLQFTVPDGSHVSANQVFALVEVMKLVLELRVPASGVISHKRIPGSTLEPGTELAHLQLDDPTQLVALQLYTGALSLPCGSHPSSTHGRRSVGDVHNLYVGSLDALGDSSAQHLMDTHKKRASTSVIPLESQLTSRPYTSSIYIHNGSNQHAIAQSSTANVPGTVNPCISVSKLNFEKLHHNFYNLFASLEQVLLGYALPEPFLTAWLHRSLEQLMSFLHDPRLPLSELQDTIANLSGRLPLQLEHDLRTQAKLYAGQVTSVMANFPSTQILRLVESHLMRLRHSTGTKSSSDPNTTSSSNEVLRFQQSVQRLVDLAHRYQNGLRSHATFVLSQLLLGYVVVERHFQYGQYDKCARQLMARCNSTSVCAAESDANYICANGDEEAEDTFRVPVEWVAPAIQNLVDPRTVADVVAVIFSHRHLTAKNALVVRLIDLIRERRELSTACNLKGSLTALTELGATENSKVALSARQLLIAMQTPSYELRRNQAESIFLSSIDVYGHQFHPENLHKLITSETVVFDIICDFFYHPNSSVASAALEVYVRRSYTAYELTSIQHFQLSNGAQFVPFRFTMPTTQCLTSEQSHPRRSLGSNTLRHTRNSDFGTETTQHTLRSRRYNSQLLSDVPSTENCASSPMHVSCDIVDTCNLTGEMGRPVDGSLHNLLTSFKNPVKVGMFSSMGERMGGMAAFNSLEELKESFAELTNLYREVYMEARTIQSSLSEPSLFNFGRVSFADTNQDSNRSSAMTELEDEPIHILNIALRYLDKWNDSSAPSSGFTCGSDYHVKPSEIAALRAGQSDSRLEVNDVRRLEEFCAQHKTQLRSAGIRRVTFLIVKTRDFPNCYTFRARDEYREDRVYRHLEPALAFQLELNRMRNYELEQLHTLNRRMHLYLAKSKIPISKGTLAYRFFVRCIIRHADLLSREASFEFLQSEAERTLLEAMDALEMAHTHPDAVHTMGNHIFLNFAPILSLEDMNHLRATIRRTVLRYASRLVRLRVTEAELKLRIRLQPTEPPIPIRVTVTDEQGYDLGLNVYREVLHPTTDELLLWSFGPPRGPQHGQPALLLYENKGYLQLKRFQARKFNTTYVYDYPKVISQALHALWGMYSVPGQTSYITGRDDSYIGSNSRDCESGQQTMAAALDEEIDEVMVLSCTELALNEDCQLEPVFRPLGCNTVGIIVWHMVLRTPDSPSGRAVIVIANDATFMAGSFGPAEDLTFHRASQLARHLGIPRIYMASNTGARIRVAEDVKAVFRVAWIDPAHPDKGYDYLYLVPEDYERLHAHNTVNCERIEVDGEVRYKILDIVGQEFDMSVENLRGSAMIAGETSTAYDDIFTLTIVTNRSIGIGAYLARLGQRVIQVKNSHIILTGAMALNKLLGREVYSSNSQLGGVQVMANNGVSHLVSSDELSALQQALEWLTYVPAQRGHCSPVMFRPVPLDRFQPNTSCSIPELKSLLIKQNEVSIPFDPIDRSVDYTPNRNRANDDPRWMFTGVMVSQLLSTNDAASKRSPVTFWNGNDNAAMATTNGDHWLSGFFDWGTWREVLAAWAAGVVVGRARLGGIPCGVITSETRSVTCRVPADPANLSTEAQVVNQAGQVWYPDSAYKTAQAITDMAREHLPLFVFANWRGFSGGMKDMFDQVLKFGSMIIDSLHRYPEPVFVYLPPHSQLRGGAWVVVDPAINPDRIELYADPVSCRAGVLEPEGTVEIKFRKADLIKTMRRLDERCRQLVDELDRLQTGGPATNEDLHAGDLTMSTADRCHQLQMALESRQKELQPFYLQVACTFADLHDTPGRLHSRDLVHGLIPWSGSRKFFYGRLRRKLLELRATHLIGFVLETRDPNSSLDCRDALTDYLANLNVTSHSPRSRELLDQDRIVQSSTSELCNQNATLGKNGIPHIRFAVTSSRPERTEVIPCHVDQYDCLRVSTTETICKSVPKLAVQYAPNFNRALSHLRQWFIESSLQRLMVPLCDIGENNVSVEPGDNLIKVSRMTDEDGQIPVDLSTSTTGDSDEWNNLSHVWYKNDIVVGDWIAEQLEIESLVHIPNMDTLVPGVRSVVGHHKNRSPSVFRRNLDKLKCDAMFEQLQNFLSKSPHVTDRLGAVLTEVLDSNQRTRLVEILTRLHSPIGCGDGLDHVG